MVLFLMLAGTSIFSGGQKEEGAVAPEGPLIFMSTQMTPAKEQAFAKNELLKGFTDGTGIEVAFINVEYFEIYSTFLVYHCTPSDFTCLLVCTFCKQEV